MTEFPDTRDSLIAALYSADNREAWEQFVVLYRPIIYRMARKRGLQNADAQDLTQAILAKVAAAIGQYESKPDGPPFRHWLRKVSKNTILTALARTPQDRGVGGSEVHERLNREPEVLSEIEREIALEHCREKYLRGARIVKSDVGGETWQAFEMTVIQQIPCEQAAHQLGKSVGTIYASRSRVLKRLRAEIQRMEKYEN